MEKNKTWSTIIDLAAGLALMGMGVGMGTFIGSSVKDFKKNKLSAQNDKLKTEINDFQTRLKYDSINKGNWLTKYGNDTSFNTLKVDSPILRVTNLSEDACPFNVSNPCWKGKLNFKYGDTIRVKFNYHNEVDKILRNSAVTCGIFWIPNSDSCYFIGVLFAGNQIITQDHIFSPSNPIIFSHLSPIKVDWFRNGKHTQIPFNKEIENKGFKTGDIPGNASGTVIYTFKVELEKSKINATAYKVVI